MLPESSLEVALSTGIVLIGIILNSVIIGTFSSIVTQANESISRHKLKMDGIERYLRTNRVPRELTQTIHAYYRYIWAESSADGLFDDLSPSLKLQLSLAVMQPFIKKCSLFAGVGTACVEAVVKRLVRRIAIPGELLCAEGEVGHEMYFIARGVVAIYKYLDARQKLLAKLTIGNNFGETAMLKDDPRNATVQATMFTELYVLSRTAFEQIVNESADMRSALKQHIQRLEQQLSVSLALKRWAKVRAYVFGEDSPYKMSGRRRSSSRFVDVVRSMTQRRNSETRLVSQAEALQVWDLVLKHEGSVHAKCARIHAKLMTEEGIIKTEVEGKVEAQHEYERGDYILCGSRGGRYPMPGHQFSSRYDTAHVEPASDPLLASDGFKLFKAKGKVWSHKLTPDEVVEHFPNGRFLGKWGGVVKVAAGDVVVMPYPAGGEVYTVKGPFFDSTYAFDRDVPSRAPAAHDASASSSWRAAPGAGGSLSRMLRTTTPLESNSPKSPRSPISPLAKAATTVAAAATAPTTAAGGPEAGGRNHDGRARRRASDGDRAGATAAAATAEAAAAAPGPENASAAGLDGGGGGGAEGARGAGRLRERSHLERPALFVSTAAVGAAATTSPADGKADAGGEVTKFLDLGTPKRGGE